MTHTFEKGKYEVTFNETTGIVNSYRHGLLYKDLTGDELTLAMLKEIDNLKKRNKKLKKKLKEVSKSGVKR